MENILKLAIFGAAALGIEVIFTALAHLKNPKKRNRQKLFGYSSLWYLPIYGLGVPAVLYLLRSPLEGQHWILRGLVYGLFLQVGEFISMGLLHVANGESPSEEEYKASGRSLFGFVRPDFFPAFAVMGLIFEYLYRTLF
ncbi:MAG TPA: hypothetical protein VK674_00740 [Candidatus Limnocylindria bacterium]|nr:hypothetical protein [Candidatus Limnocylindria bacterium]